MEILEINHAVNTGTETSDEIGDYGAAYKMCFCRDAFATAAISNLQIRRIANIVNSMFLTDPACYHITFDFDGEGPYSYMAWGYRYTEVK